METEKRRCACCGEGFEVNPRAKKTHRYCLSEPCQRERRRLAQKARREHERQERARPSRTSRRSRADYMRDYRRHNAAYRERERLRAAARRRDAAALEVADLASGRVVTSLHVPIPTSGTGALTDPASGRVVTEAGLESAEVRASVVRDRDGNAFLRVVTKSGEGFVVRLAAAS